MYFYPSLLLLSGGPLHDFGVLLRGTLALVARWLGYPFPAHCCPSQLASHSSGLQTLSTCCLHVHMQPSVVDEACPARSMDLTCWATLAHAVL